MDTAITLKRQGKGYYSVHLHGERLSRMSVWDSRRLRERGWVLSIQGGVLSEPRQETFRTLALLRAWVERTYAGGDGVGAAQASWCAECGSVSGHAIGCSQGSLAGWGR